MSLTRQILFLLPLLLLLPRLAGIDGIMYAGPVADAFAGLTAILMIGREFRWSEYQEVEKSALSRE